MSNKINEGESLLEALLIDPEGRSTFRDIRLNEDHFRVCNKCKSINYYTNKKCVLCDSEDLDNSINYELNTFNEILAEYTFYLDKGFNKDDIGNYKLTVANRPGFTIKESKDFQLNKYLTRLAKRKKTTKL